jgi:hypothetical protein
MSDSASTTQIEALDGIGKVLNQNLQFLEGIAMALAGQNLSVPVGQAVFDAGSAVHAGLSEVSDSLDGLAKAVDRLASVMESR